MVTVVVVGATTLVEKLCARWPVEGGGVYISLSEPNPHVFQETGKPTTYKILRTVTTLP